MRAIFYIAMLIILLATPFAVSADIAPPARPPGANPVPGSADTQVRMMAESVQINIAAEGGREESKGGAYVTADFTMRNLGSQEEHMAVRFPLGSGDGWGGIPEIDNMRVSVNGVEVTLRQIKGEDPTGMAEEVPWVEFDVIFPPQQDVQVQVRYSLDAAGELPYIWFNYIFSTGAGWQGTIGSAELTVRFPYGVSNLNYLPGIPGSSFPMTTPGGQVDGNSITWSWKDFEPDSENNFQITLVTPPVWFDIRDERERVQQVPGDGEAWGRLGKLYKLLLMSPHGGRGFRDYSLAGDVGAQELFRLSDEAYHQSVTLKPEDALWHAGYADLLGWYSAYAGYEGFPTLDTSVRALQQMQLALELNPTDTKVLEIADYLSFYLPEGMVRGEDGYEFPWLTATPVVTATQIMPVYESPTPGPEETAALLPQETSTSQPQEDDPTSQPAGTGTSRSFPLCGSAVLIPLAVFMLIRRTR